jgi:hypothetical protein
VADIEVHLDTEALTAQIAEAVTRSVLGENVEAAIREAATRTLKGDSYGKPSVVERVVAQAIERAVRELVLERQDEVKAVVAEQLTEVALTALLSKLFEAWARQMGLG